MGHPMTEERVLRVGRKLLGTPEGAAWLEALEGQVQHAMCEADETIDARVVRQRAVRWFLKALVKDLDSGSRPPAWVARSAGHLLPDAAGRSRDLCLATRARGARSRTGHGSAPGHRRSASTSSSSSQDPGDGGGGGGGGGGRDSDSDSGANPARLTPKRLLALRDRATIIAFGFVLEKSMSAVEFTKATHDLTAAETERLAKFLPPEVRAALDAGRAGVAP